MYETESSRGGELNEAYSLLPALYLALSSIWFVSACCWTFVTWRNRHFQKNLEVENVKMEKQTSDFSRHHNFDSLIMVLFGVIYYAVVVAVLIFICDILEQSNNLQWTIASVPLIKTTQLVLSFLFWYSCFYFQICSLWMSFGVYITGILFQTASFVSFLLISHGYCIMCEHLSVQEQRITAALGCLFYLTLVGYRASVPYFTVLLLLNYIISFYVIFQHISQNLLALQEQLSVIEDDDIRAMHDAVYSKYIMFKKFQFAMQLVAVAETVLYINMDDAPNTFWVRLLAREWAQFCIFLYIGWTFRSQELARGFSVVPIVKSKGVTPVPPIYSIEMDAAAFRDFSCKEWHIGVPSSISYDESSKDCVLVLVQQPRSHRQASHPRG